MVFNGVTMSTEQEEQILQILEESRLEDDRIIAELKSSGKWIGGLDTHREAFENNKRKTIEAIRKVAEEGQ